MTDYFEYRQQMEDLQKLAEIDTAHKLAVDMQQEAAKYAKLAELAANDEIRVLRDSLRGRWTIDNNIPIFTKDRNYVEEVLPKDDEL